MKITARMQLGENAQMALTTLRENKMRSFLTVLGVVIGITALLSVVSILMGVYADVNAYLKRRCPIGARHRFHRENESHHYASR